MNNYRTYTVEEATLRMEQYCSYRERCHKEVHYKLREMRMIPEAVDRIMRFLDEKEIVTVADYMKPALLAHLGSYVPEETRHFFWITAHYDPAPLYTHFYHWFELARMDTEPHPSPIRQGALLYNIFDSRNEGTATGVSIGGGQEQPATDR